MLKNYFKIAVRSLVRYRKYTVINVLGLAVSIACCILIMLFVQSELSYDRFHAKAGRIYRMWLKESADGEVFVNTVTPIPLGPALKANIPEVESFCRVNHISGTVKLGDKLFSERVTLVDPNFFNVFNFSLMPGHAPHPLGNGTSLVLSGEMARKYFGTAEAVGKHLELQVGEEKLVFTISGVVKEVPQESSIRFDMLIPFSNDQYVYSEASRTSSFSNVYGETYVLLRDNTEAANVAGKLPSFVKQVLGSKYKPGAYNLYLQPITDIHLNNELPQGNEPVSNPAYSYILASIGALILLIACINFVTLSIGQSATRALEVGVRKTLGAARKQLIGQFWGEALFLSLLSLLAGIALSAVFLHSFNDITDRELRLNFNGATVLFCLLLVIITGLVAGIYPAIILSGFRPIEVLKGRLRSPGGIGLFRRVLITGQFVVSITMIIGTLVIAEQLNFIRNKDLGFNKESTVVVDMNKSRSEGMPLAARFKKSIDANPQVLGSSVSLYSLTEPGWVSCGYRDDRNTFRKFRLNSVDENFIQLMGIQVAAGRNFSRLYPADETNSMIVNEALVKEYGWKNAIGRRLPGKYPQVVVGVVKDFHFESLHTPIKPLVMVMKPDTMFRLSSDISFPASPRPRVTVRLRGGDIRKSLASLEATWKSVAGEQDFQFRFLDESLNNLYQEEERLGTIVTVVSGLSVFIACLGLFGLATLIVSRRTKEIGIRKVLGANIGGIITLISKEFLVMVGIASLVAYPLAWWVMNNWLQDFTYRIPIHWWIFIIAGLAAAGVALLTVSLQALKAAMLNPVKSLRTE